LISCLETEIRNLPYNLLQRYSNKVMLLKCL